MPQPTIKPLDKIFDDFQIHLEEKNIKIFDGYNNALHKAIEAQCKREFSSENWEFLQKINELNTAQTPDSISLINIFKQYIAAGSPSEININSQSRGDLQNKYFLYEENKQPLVLADFKDAVVQITKLMMSDTFKRSMQDPNFITAHKLDLIEANNEDAKLAMQLNAIELFKDVHKYTQTSLNEIHIDKPLFRFGRRPFEAAPFKSSQHIIEIMQNQLSELLHQSQKYSLAEFKEKYDTIINNNEKILAKYAEIIEKQISKMPNEDLNKKIFQAQLTQLNNVISTAKLAFQWSPQELENAKKVGISNIIHSFTSKPIVEISETEIETRSRSISFRGLDSV